MSATAARTHAYVPPLFLPTMSEEQLIKLIQRTEMFHEAVGNHVSTLIPVAVTRYKVAFESGLLSLEHATGALVLVGLGVFPPAYALMRPQYETALRGFWLAYSASDTWIAKLSQPLTLENAQRANKLPMPAEMLEDLARSNDAPQPIIEQLKMYSEVTWRALSSYTHGGLHPLARLLTGYPPQLSYDVVRNSNAIIALTAQLLSNLSGDARNMEPVSKFHKEFGDCLPIISAPSS